MEYYRLSENYNNNKLVPITISPYSLIKNLSSPHFVSMMRYSESQYSKWKQTKTLSGEKGSVTSKIWVDFDGGGKGKPETELQDSFKDSAIFFNRLLDLGIPEEAIQLSFSGNKGVGIIIETDGSFSNQEVQNFCLNLAQDLPTFDDKMYDNQRIFRLLFSKNEKTGLYKIPLTKEEFLEANIQSIKETAKSIEDYNIQEVIDFYSIYEVTDKVKNLMKARPTAKKEVTPVVASSSDLSEIDFSKKMKGFTNCKWAICDGYEVKPSDRHHKLTAIVATAKSLNALEGQAYYMAKHAMKRGVERYGGEECSKDDLEQIVKSIYSPTWQGGTYSCKDGKSPWLTSLCNSLGPHKCQAMNIDIVSASDVFDLFNDYAQNFDKNIIQTGIAPLDERCKFMVGTSNGILAPPGVGKTTLSLALLNHNSKQNNHSIFFSYDMFHSMVYLRLVQKHFNLSQETIFKIFRTDRKKSQEIRQRIEEEYKNVHFCFKSGQTADEIYETILDTENKIGNKIRLAMVDYNELIISNVGDPTQASAQTAQRLRQIANDTSVCSITLLQPSKVFSNPADEITTYQGAKGSGAIAQSLSLMISLSRPGFSPRTPENDKYLTVNALKNRMGSLFTVDLGWDGASGAIRPLSYDEELDLQAVREKKKIEAEAQSSGGSWS